MTIIPLNSRLNRYRPLAFPIWRSERTDPVHNRPMKERQHTMTSQPDTDTDTDTEFEFEWVLHNWVPQPTIIERQPFLYSIRIGEWIGSPIDRLADLED